VFLGASFLAWCKFTTLTVSGLTVRRASEPFTVSVGSSVRRQKVTFLIFLCSQTPLRHSTFKKLKVSCHFFNDIYVTIKYIKLH
jgi:hypothetical protein